MKGDKGERGWTGHKGQKGKKGIAGAKGDMGQKGMIGPEGLYLCFVLEIIYVVKGQPMIQESKVKREVRESSDDQDLQDQKVLCLMYLCLQQVSGCPSAA